MNGVTAAPKPCGAYLGGCRCKDCTEFAKYMAASMSAQSAGFGGFNMWMPPPQPMWVGPLPSFADPVPDTKPEAAAEAKKDLKLPPMNCLRCNFRNEYVGKEHLDGDGKYTCRTCRGVR